MIKPSLRKTNGFVLPATLGIIIVISIIAAATFTIIGSNLYSVNYSVKRQQALNIAEAGVNYYLWHLSHNPTDYKDGNTEEMTPDPELGYGPFEHQYYDDNNINTGSYNLYLKPQSSGSTVVKVRSIGRVNNSDAIRTVDALIGAPSFASYGLVSDSALWFGNTETASGPVHSNQGIRMDGANTAEVTSSNTTYVPPYSLGGDGSAHPGVWCKSTVTTPIDCNSRNKSDWQFPVPSVDFNNVSGNLCDIKKTAFEADASTSSLASQTNACSQTPNTTTDAYLKQRSTSGYYNTSRGYLIQLNPDNTYDLFRVNGENDTYNDYSSALSLQTQDTNIPIPDSGVIFAEDNVWVRSDPTFSGRLTIAAGRLATSAEANIVVADDLVYGTKNGSDALGLVAEDSVLIAPYAPPNSGAFTFEVNAAMIAQEGTVEFPSRYRSSYYRCTEGWVNDNQQFEFYGSVATRQRWTWTWLWGGSCGDNTYDPAQGYYISGVLNNNTQYDYNLLYAPPPKFPITSNYNILSWREILTKP